VGVDMGYIVSTSFGIFADTKAICNYFNSSFCGWTEIRMESIEDGKKTA
jgi:hypothetical protein